MFYSGLGAQELCHEILEGEALDGRYPLHVGDCGVFPNDVGSWTAFDNTSGDCWVEDFKTEREAIEWLIF